MAELKLLHTSDFHGRLTREKALRLAQLKHDHDALLFDCGDSLKAGNIGLGFAREPTIVAMNEIGYTAKTLGNREFHLWVSAFQRKTGRFAMPLVCANLVMPQEARDLVKPYYQLEHEGVKIGVTGLMVPMVKPGTFWEGKTRFAFSSPVDAAREVVAELRPKVDLLIALTHIGLKEDCDLAEQVPEIDVILGGHTHSLTEQPIIKGKTVIVHSGYHARTAGLLRLEGTGNEWYVKHWQVIAL